jgi:hypothetical protein
MEILKKLQGKLQEQLDRVTPEDHEQWLNHPATKALLLGMEIDYFDLQSNWANGRYEGSEFDGMKALGQTQYIMWNRDAIHRMVDSQ